MSRVKEAQGHVSLDTFELLAASITFLPCPSLHVLLAPVLARLQAEDPAPTMRELHR